VGKPGPTAGNADSFARKSPAHNVNLSPPWLAVEGSHVVPDGELGQDAVPLPLQEHSPAVRLNLDSTDAGMPEKHPAEDSSPRSSKKV